MTAPASNHWTLGHVFAARVREHPERPLVVAGKKRWSYAQIDQQSSALAAALAELGIEAEDRIAIDLPNWPEWIISLLAAAKLGAVVVPVNPHLSYHELKYQLRHAEVSAAVAAERIGDIDYLDQFEELIAELPDLQYVVTVGKEELWYDDRIFQFEDLVSSGEGRPVPTPRVLDHTDLAVMYTSGTTGKPKGVRLSHRNLVETAIRTGEAVEIDPTDRVFVGLPVFAIFGFGVVIGAMCAGATVVLQDTFDAAEALRILEEERVTVFHGVPTMFQLLMREPGFDPARLTRLRTGIVAGSDVPEELVARIRRWCDVQIAYGLTETSGAVASTRFGDPESARATTVGRPIPGVDIVAVDPESRRPLPPDTVGELAVRGPNVMQGYARMPTETARSFTPDGFLLTGDLGSVDPDGHVRIVGRSKETINRAGYQIFPREVEDQLRAHPAVDDVCVIGVPHTLMGELVCACVVPVEGAVITAGELQEFARDTMADYKVPDLVRFFDALPKTGTGKPMRREIERMVALEHTATTGSS